MPTAQKQREQIGTWGQIFPNEQISAQQSALFMKKLLAVAISNITYLRAIFPEQAFGDRCLEDLNLKILKDDTSCPGACQVIQWVKGCFDALEKKYLKVITIGIYSDPENPDSVIESYTFKFSYNEGGGVDIFRNKDKISSAHSAAETKKATIRLLRTIVILTQSLNSLPDGVYMTMKLQYYDDVTPLDYEPPGFKASDIEGFLFEEEPLNIKVGDVITPFHTLKLRIKTDGKQFESAEPLTELTENIEEPVDDQVDDNRLDEDEGTDTLQSFHEQIVPHPAEADSVPGDSPNQPGSEMKAASTTGSQQMSIQSQEDYGISCACGYNEDDGLMILCAKCKTWQHGICHRILKEIDAPERHICDACADPQKPDMVATDPHLMGLTPIAKEATCLWRRALFACQEISKILVPTMAKRLGVETTVAHGLLSRLEKEGFVKPAKTKRLGKTVDKDALQVGINKYLIADLSKDFVVNHNQKWVEKNNNVNNEIDRITMRAENMNLQENKIQPRNSKAEDEDFQMAPNPTDTKRGMKRVKPTTGPDNYDFEVCNSQEILPKKRKSSMCKKGIQV